MDTATVRHFVPHPLTPDRHNRRLLLYRLSSPKPQRLFTTISCFNGRRRTRWKNKLQTISITRTPRVPSSSFSSERNFQIAIDIDKVTAEVSFFFYYIYYLSRSKVRRFISSGSDAFDDLRTLVAFDHQNRILTISCRHSTAKFLGQLVLLSIVVHFVVKGLIGIGSSFFKKFSSGHTSPVVRRDRSLGGKEVAVGTGSSVVARGKATASLNLTDVSDEVSKNGVRVGERLPKWWPPAVPRQITTANRQEYQDEANRLVRALVDNRMSGRDFMEDDIVQLRQICRTSGVKVSFNTENMCDSFYRASVDFVLNIYSRTPVPPNSVLINGEDGPNFVAGLAEDIGIENVRAARIVSAAVAARMRSCFLQAWALVMQDRQSEANAELLKICYIIQIFPPEESSPEMEMLTLGLKKHLKVEQRETLMNMFIGVCGKDSHRTAAEALGLVLPPNVGN
ncbi:hypothetical protein SDJN03_22059, partial [Cucurbita argyrosperma subsp. sororia]